MLVEGLIGDSVCKGYAGDPSWLCAGDVGVTGIQQELGHLSRFATPSVTSNYQHLIVPKLFEYLIFVLRYGKVGLPLPQLLQLGKLLLLQEVDVGAEDLLELAHHPPG